MSVKLRTGILALFLALATADAVVPQLAPNAVRAAETAPQSAMAAVGKPAPQFTLSDSHGKPVALSDYKEKFVVLEWTNFDCPFVQKHYGSGNMQKLQVKYTAKGVVWLTINSSSPGRPGNYPNKKINELITEHKAHQTAYLIDESGKVGRLYGAKTTPDMFVIDPMGKLVYAGAIDDKNTTDEEDIKSANNYVEAALDAAMAGKPVAIATTKSYGCSIKYHE